jgi:prepilin-type processing-associated H-X9-DG protein
MDAWSLRRRQRRAAQSDPDRPRTSSPGFTILELLVVVGVLSTLTAVILPAIGAAREAARRMQCFHQLRQVGLALHCYHDSFQCFPAGWQWEETEASAYGWAVPVLPFLDQQPAYALVDRNRLLTDPANAEVLMHRIPVLSCPSDIAGDQFDLFAEQTNVAVADATIADQLLVTLPSANYVGVYGNSEPDDAYPPPPGEGAFIDSRPFRFADLLRGPSNTLLIGERTAAQLPSTWLGVERRGEDATCRLVGNAAVGPNCRECDECEFSSRHDGGANFLWADGRVELISDAIDASTFRQLARRAD